MDSIRTNILNTIKLKLQDISLTNGYKQDIQAIYDDKFDMPEAFNDFPILFIIDGDEDKEWFDEDQQLNKLNVIITGYCKKLNDTDDVQLKRRNLQADVEKALMQDQRVGGYALSIRPSKLVTDKGTIEPYAIFDLTFIVEYTTKLNDPYSN